MPYFTVFQWNPPRRLRAPEVGLSDIGKPCRHSFKRSIDRWPCRHFDATAEAVIHIWSQSLIMSCRLVSNSAFVPLTLFCPTSST